MEIFASAVASLRVAATGPELALFGSGMGASAGLSRAEAVGESACGECAGSHHLRLDWKWARGHGSSITRLSYAGRYLRTEVIRSKGIIILLGA